MKNPEIAIVARFEKLFPPPNGIEKVYGKKVYYVPEYKSWYIEENTQNCVLWSRMLDCYKAGVVDGEIK